LPSFFQYKNRNFAKFYIQEGICEVMQFNHKCFFYRYKCEKKWIFLSIPWIKKNVWNGGGIFYILSKMN